MHLELPEKVSLISIDVAWTKQRYILPAAKANLLPGGTVITLIKPHYEADPARLKRGILPPEEVDAVVAAVSAEIRELGFQVQEIVQSPITGAQGNVEVLARLCLQTA